HRELVREARTNIAHEIADNKRDLDGALAKASEVEQSQRTALQFVEEQLAHRKSGTRTLDLSYGIVELRRSSWETAQATRAVSYMEYAEVKRYSELYGLQKRLDTLQDQLLNNFILALPPQDLAKAGDAKLRHLH